MSLFQVTNILYYVYEYYWGFIIDVFKVQNTCVVETLGHEHSEKLRQRLLDEGYPLIWNPAELES